MLGPCGLEKNGVVCTRRTFLKVQTWYKENHDSNTDVLVGGTVCTVFTVIFKRLNALLFKYGL